MEAAQGPALRPRPPLDPSSAARVLAMLDAPEPELHANNALPALPGYQIERLIGSGGGGDVYLARRDGSDRPVALKLIRLPGSDGVGSKKRSNSLDRAFRELHLLEETRLSCTPRLLDYGMHEGRLFIAVEFIEGEPLDKHCEQHGLALKARAELLAKAADAVQMLHERGLIHRDLKPTNIIVTHPVEGPPGGDVMLIDLGIAVLAGAAAGATLTEEGCPIGTPAFMAPEQARGDRQTISTRSDIYALGATAYTLLTGATPHLTDTSLADAIRRVSFDPPRDPRELNPALPKPLAAVLCKAVSPRPADRYATAAEFGADLRRWMRGEAVEAVVPGVWRRVGRWAGRRPKTATGLVCAIIALLSIVTTFAFVWWVNQEPFRVEGYGPSTRLMARSGRILHQWGTGAESSVLFSALVNRPPASGGGQIVIVAFGTQSDSPQLCSYEVSRPDNPLWCSGTGADSFTIPELAGFGAPPSFRVGFMTVADVFPDLPGDEIVATFHHVPWGVCCIRVYDLGRV